MSGVMLNFKGKMYKLCEKKDMDRKTKSVSVSKAMSKPKPVKPMKKSKSVPNLKPKKSAPKSAPPKKSAPKSAPPKKSAPKSAPPKKAPKKVKKQIKVEGFPVFKGDEPKAKEEKRRDNNLY